MVKGNARGGRWRQLLASIREWLSGGGTVSHSGSGLWAKVPVKGGSRREPQLGYGQRVSEAIDLRLKAFDLGTARVFVRRKKGSLSTHQPLEGDEVRALRAWGRKRELRSEARSSYLFLSERGPMTRQAVNYLVKEIGRRAKLRFRVHPHMLRHSTEYSLANRGYDTWLIQDDLGHKNIAHTVKYTRTAAVRFEGLWR